MWVNVCAFVCKGLYVCVYGFVRLCLIFCAYVGKGSGVCV